MILTAEVPHLEELARWILAGAPNAEVLEPPALKYIVRDLALSVIDEL
ncbi:MAG: WYL domain-containing protein [Synergistaceae bacterium]|nr:WYL domain-containing protein [Synergistaceae bacterium]